MAHTQQIVDRLRAALSGTDPAAVGTVIAAVNDGLPSLATAYAEACREANERLARCGVFLRQGLRSEALALAETEPKLLDVVAALDFPERVEWEAQARQAGMTRPPGLLLEVAGALNEAYAQEEPIREILRVHRRQALARAPLTQRIATVRQLARIDVENPLWVDDLKVLEAARIEQVRREADTARSLPPTEMAQALETLAQELESPDWVEPPPPALVRALRAAAHRRSLESLVPQMEAALALGEVEMGRDLRQRWIHTAKLAGVTAGHPLWERARAPLDWLAGEDRRVREDQDRRDAFAELEAALDDPHSSAELLRELVQAVGTLDASLDKRLDERLKALARAQERKARTRRAALAVGGLVFAVLVALWVREDARSRRAYAAAETLRPWLASREVELASRFLEDLRKSDPRVFESAEMASVLTQFEALEASERVRRNDLAGLEARIDAATDPTTLDVTDQVRLLTRTAAERARLEQKIEDRRRTLTFDQSKIADALAGRVRALEIELGAFEGPDGRARLSSEDAGARVDAAAAELERLRTGAGQPGSPLRSRLEQLTARLDTVLRARADRRRQAETLASLRTTLDPDDPLALAAWAGSVRNLTGKFPDEPRFTSLAKTLDEIPDWTSALAWSNLLRSWPVPRATPTPTEAAKRVEACKGALSNQPNGPDTPVIKNYLAWIEPIAARGLTPGAPGVRLKALLSDSLVDGVLLLKLRNGKGYYLRQPSRKVGAASVQFRYVADFELNERNFTTRPEDVVSEDEAPQALLAKRIRPHVEALTEKPADWESECVKILEEVRKDTVVDPIFRRILLLKVIEAAGEGSLPLRKALTPFRTALEAALVPADYNWLDPDRPANDPPRTRARQTISGAPPLVNVLGSVESDRRALEAEVGRIRRAAGWLLKDGASWTIEPGRLPIAGNATLEVVSGGRWQNIGRDGRLDFTKTFAFAPGRVVFVVEDGAP